MTDLTRLADLTALASPGAAPGDAALLARDGEPVRAAAPPILPERTIAGAWRHDVADQDGVLHLRNVGGLGATAGTFSPTITAPGAMTLVGVLHTHPYDRTEESYNGVSPSGGDFAHLINLGYLLSVVQSGSRLFALVRTAQTAASIPWTRQDDQNDPS